MEYIFGSAGIIIIFFIIVELSERFFGRDRKDAILYDLELEKKRRENEIQLEEINRAIIDKRKAYEDKKEKLYDLLEKRDSNNSPPNSNEPK